MGHAGDEAKAKMLDGDWASTDTFYIGLVTNAAPPTAAQATPVWGDFTEASPTTGNYSANGQALDTLANMVTEAAGTMTFDDTGATVTWAQHANNPTNASWGIIYNFTDAGKDAVAYIDLTTDGGTTPVDMTAGDLTITWHANGIFRIV